MFKTELAHENWENKYRFGKEEPLDTFKRVAKFIASAEKPKLRKYWYNKFLKTIVNFDHGDPIGLKCTTGGRITANAGTSYEKATILNCFISGPVSGAKIEYTRKSDLKNIKYKVKIKSSDNPDSLVNIFLTIMEQAKTLASEGGYGINFDFIRPRGSLIKGTGIKHPGIVSYMKVWDAVSECIVKGTDDGYEDKIKNYLGNASEFEKIKRIVKTMTRKGAQMGCLSVWHPDIEEFIRAKQIPGTLTKFNMSVAVDDAFMRAVEKNDMYDLHFGGKKYKRVKARDLYELMMKSMYNRAEPGIIFVDNMHANNPVAYLGKAKTTNPCGEVPGIDSLTTVCLLGSFNLTQYVVLNQDKSYYFDIKNYKEDIKTLTRMLDNLNDLAYNPLPSYDWAVKNLRQFGMGLNGLGSVLAMLRIPYNSKEAVEFTKNLCETKENLTWQTSALLAKEKGKFPAYSKKEFENTDYFLSDRINEETKRMLRKYGARNAKTTTNPPLGNCVVKSTKIITDNGVKTMSDIFKENEIQINKERENTWYVPLKEINVKTLQGFKRITGLYINTKGSVLNVGSNNKTLIKGTGNHKVLINAGDKKGKWIKIKDLKLGDKIIMVRDLQ